MVRVVSELWRHVLTGTDLMLGDWIVLHRIDLSIVVIPVCIHPHPSGMVLQRVDTDCGLLIIQKGINFLGWRCEVWGKVRKSVHAHA